MSRTVNRHGNQSDRDEVAFRRLERVTTEDTRPEHSFPVPLCWAGEWPGLPIRPVTMEGQRAIGRTETCLPDEHMGTVLALTVARVAGRLNRTGSHRMGLRPVTQCA